MSNRQIFKQLYSKKINKEDNYKMIIKNIETEDINMKRTMWKWAFVPVCLMMVLFGIMFADKNNDQIIYEKNHEIYINSIESNGGLARLDADIKIVNGYMIPYFEFLVNLNIPNDFDSKENFSTIYVRKDKESRDYDILNNYELWCANTNNHRRIMIAFSDKYEPLRDYFFSDEGSKVSKINNLELTLYKYENSYMTTFTYQGINFDIETTDITEQEFIDLLVSIIK